MYINGDELKVILLEIYETLNIQTDCNFTDILYEQLKNYENDENVAQFFQDKNHCDIIPSLASEKEITSLRSELITLLQDIKTHQTEELEKGPIQFNENNER